MTRRVKWRLAKGTMLSNLSANITAKLVHEEQTKMIKHTLAAAVIAVASFGVAGQADAYSKRVKRACKTDFYRFCPSYKVGSSKLKSCMRSAGGNLSRRCVDSLADSGQISRKYHSRFRRR